MHFSRLTITSRARKLARLLAMMMPLSLFAACAMVDSSTIGYDDSDGCSGDSGAYYLSRTVLHIKVEKGDETTGNQVKLSMGIAREPDRNQGYCLDFLASPTAEEAVFVQKTSNHLLSKITTQSKDRSVNIAKSLIKIAAVLLSGDPGTARASKAQLAQAFSARYDPFNEAQTALVNEQLRQHNICLVVESTVGGDLSAIESYCDNPMGQRNVETAMREASDYVGQGKVVNYTRGLLYRPRLPYNYFIYYKKPNPRTGIVGWTLAETKTLSFENASPIISLGIDRAFFTERKTTILFDDGALYDVDIEKGSEIASAVEIPLELASTLVKIPSKAVQFRIDNTNRRTNLINAQGALLQNQRALNQTKAQARGQQYSGQGDTAAPGVGVPQRGYRPNNSEPEPIKDRYRDATFTGNRDQCIGRCLNKYADSSACTKYCQCRLTNNSWVDLETKEAFCASSLTHAQKKQ